MRFKPVKKPALDKAGAEALAAEGLVFLTADGDRLSRFLGETGLSPDALAEGVSGGGAGVIDAALDYIAADESLLLVFATEVRRKPEEIMLAQAMLSGRMGGDHD